MAPSAASRVRSECDGPVSEKCSTTGSSSIAPSLQMTAVAIGLRLIRKRQRLSISSEPASVQCDDAKWVVICNNIVICCHTASNNVSCTRSSRQERRIISCRNCQPNMLTANATGFRCRAEASAASANADESSTNAELTMAFATSACPAVVWHGGSKSLKQRLSLMLEATAREAK